VVSPSWNNQMCQLTDLAEPDTAQAQGPKPAEPVEATSDHLGVAGGIEGVVAAAVGQVPMAAANSPGATFSTAVVTRVDSRSLRR
jgi:hypothetical protein